MTHPRRLFLLSNGFQSEYEAGFANGVARNGIEVTLISSDNTLSDRLDPAIRTVNLRGSQSGRRSALAKALNIIRYVIAYAHLGLKHRDAIFHFCGLFTLRKGFGVAVEAVLARLVFKTWWLTVHNLLPHDDDRRSTRLIFGLVYKLPQRLFVHTSQLKRQLIAQFGIAPEKITVIDHGIDRFIPPVPTAREEVATAFGLPPHKTLLLVFGNLSPYKGVEDLLDALAGIELPPEVVLLVAGKPSSNPLRESILKKVKGHPHASRIRLHLGYVDEHLIVPLLSAADAMILPYRHIDQSGVLFAAKSAGLPCILTDVGSFAEYAEPQRDILIAPRNGAALANAVLRFCMTPHRGSRDQAVQAAEDRFAWRHTLVPYAEEVTGQHITTKS
ncbi:glycosyltransferase [Sphaerotilus microaerophilus]|uniref:Glycosyltransferase subfamily 4-like N-terminal domain-containing protein n=1 Tax=Sphaerotilus microaerophilus TaxID=2914710 RepID=A0ABN6PIT3_9BURK|nr:glycosyltransferase [Sphaerotilus sp. FB-5]BDI04941.1 hypothetical protein CATMQ487_19110 [Sphaerotilus sp. FB-5]